MPSSTTDLASASCPSDIRLMPFLLLFFLLVKVFKELELLCIPSKPSWPLRRATKTKKDNMDATDTIVRMAGQLSGPGMKKRLTRA